LKHLGLLLLCTGLAQADAIGVGVRGGFPFGDAFESLRTGNLTLEGKNRFVVGPTLELRLPMGFGLSFDALFRGYRFPTTSPSGTSSETGHQWEFPLMVRYHFPMVMVRPFIAGGPVWQRLSAINSTSNATGVAFATGLDIKIPLLHVTPELRWTHRLTDPIYRGLLRANSNQFDLLVGVTF
jgi:hypothetical protein